MSNHYLITAYNFTTIAEESVDSLNNALDLFEMMRRDWPDATVEVWFASAIVKSSEVQQ